MKAANIKQKNQDMAARMKREGVTRHHGRCPICNNMVRIDMYRHIVICR